MVDFSKKEQYKIDWISNEEFAKIYMTIDMFMVEVPKRNRNNLLNEPTDFFPMWSEIIWDNQIDNEYCYVYDCWENALGDDVWEDDISEAVRAYNNGLTWIETAKRVFAEKVRIFYSTLADKKVYLKHFSNPGWGEKRIISTSHSRALLIPNISLDILDKVFTEIILRFYKQIYYRGFNQIIVYTNSIVGYSKGKPCYAMLYKLDYTSFVYHVYPINDDEFAQYRITLLEKREELIDGMDQEIEVEIDNILHTILI